MSRPPLPALRRFTLFQLLGATGVLWAISVALGVLNVGGVPVMIALIVFALVILAASVIMILYAADGARWRIAARARLYGAAAAVGVAGLAFVDDKAHFTGATLYGIYIGSVTVYVGPGRRLVTGLAGVVPILVMVLVLRLPLRETLFVLLTAGACIASFGPQWWAYEVAARLDQARKVAGELAVAEERLRFAAELHDIQGHHLQVIALKSELAARLGQSRPAEAVELMREVQQLARDALTDTKAVVGGYRRVSFRTELSNAVKVLRAAGITTQADFAAAPEGETGRLLGLVVREATTNILRHSQASEVSLRLAVRDDRAELMVCNDGAAAGATPTGHRAEDEAGCGSGLRTLARRLDEAGGRLRWAAADGRFTVTATLEAA
jgi:two-component system, NarL family, sensor histidine kinase DesK